jgi:N,N'-diacetyllegionaminate synthase
MVTDLRIGSRSIGPHSPIYVIAEAGVNHNGQRDLAIRLIDAAVDAGADAVKFQTFNADLLVTPSAPKADYQKLKTDAAESQHAMLRRLELKPEDYAALKEHASKRGIEFLSTPFDIESAGFLDHLGVHAFKIASGELTDLRFLAQLAQKKKPLIISTGMSTLDEVKAAVQTVKDQKNSQIALLHCVSNYPAAPSDINLRAIPTMQEAFQIPVGYSDHALGNEIAFAAAALGAQIIEKHLTLDRTMEGPDHAASAEPADFKHLVAGLRTIERALGSGTKVPAASEQGTALVARKSLVAACDIPAGSQLTEDLIACKRPGTGMPASMLSQIVGRKVAQPIQRNAPIKPEMLV